LKTVALLKVADNNRCSKEAPQIKPRPHQQQCRSSVRLCRSNIRRCRKNRSTCSIRLCLIYSCFRKIFSTRNQVVVHHCMVFFIFLLFLKQ